MTNEVNVLISNDPWELVPQTYANNLVASKWFFHIEFNFDGSLECYKVRAVAASNHHQQVLTSKTLFTPIVCPASFIHCCNQSLAYSST